MLLLINTELLRLLLRDRLPQIIPHTNWDNRFISVLWLACIAGVGDWQSLGICGGCLRADCVRDTGDIELVSLVVVLLLFIFTSSKHKSISIGIVKTRRRCR